MQICYYVNGHGLGHASRSEAIAEALLEAERGLVLELRTPVPRGAFAGILEAAGGRCLHSAIALDPGVVQSDSFHHDLGATLAAWRSRLAEREAFARAEAAHLAGAGARLVVSDASPLPCLAAQRAGIPALVVGNFTWDWILEGYLEEEPGFAPLAAELRQLYATARAYLRLPMSPEPPRELAEVRRIGLVSRRARRPRDLVRGRLGLAPQDRAALLCFGGFGASDLSLDALARRRPPALRCVWDRELSRPPWLISAAGLALHYSDLVRAADLVFSKPGFSTISDAVAQRRPLVYVPRGGFREGPLLEHYLHEELRWPALRLPYSSLADGSRGERALAWPEEPPSFPAAPTEGAAEAARAILSFCS